MATIESLPSPNHDRPRRIRPFSSWMKKLTNFKGSSSTDANQTPKRNAYQMKSHSKKNGSKNNNPYMSSAQPQTSSTAPVNGDGSFSTAPTGRTASASSIERSRHSFRSSEDDRPVNDRGARSVAHTVSTLEHEVGTSDIAQSHGASSGAGTAVTVGPSTGRGADSTFSSPAHSVRSLTTTLTTIQSANMLPGAIGAGSSNSNSGQGQNPHSVIFSHQFPTSPPPSALPAHLAPQTSGGHPSTYNTATANNLLTDNASILTLASSSKRRRRRSMDTDASVRAMAPSSLFGGSRESLPLSVLSANIDHSTLPNSSIHQSHRHGGPADRASIYSSTGVAPALSTDRNSYYAGKQGQSILGDGGSIKSGLLGHGRTDSISGSIGGIAAGSPLASPRDVSGPTIGRLSRTNSAWGDTAEDIEAEVREEEKAEEKRRA